MLWYRLPPSFPVGHRQQGQNERSVQLYFIMETITPSNMVQHIAARVLSIKTGVVVPSRVIAKYPGGERAFAAACCDAGLTLNQSEIMTGPFADRKVTGWMVSNTSPTQDE